MKTAIAAIITLPLLILWLLPLSMVTEPGGVFTASDGEVFLMVENRPKGAPIYSESGFEITPLSRSSVRELASKLDEKAYAVTQNSGTERAFTGELLENTRAGTYCCAVCDLPLFASETKFDSGTGWPSYFKPIDPAHVLGKPDHRHGMTRIENICGRCGAHLGHVFEDGPEPTGLRFCINSAAMVFYEEGEERPATSKPVETETAYFAGGCFWGIEHYFGKGPGVLKAVSGYMQGELKNPTYQDVIRGNTGHAETVKVIYDPNHITYERLLEAFFVMHDPTQLNRQGPDVGEHYRSGIWYNTEEQRRQAEAHIEQLNENGKYDRPIVTQVEHANRFWRAEDYHQNYISRTGRPCNVTNPW